MPRREYNAVKGQEGDSKFSEEEQSLGHGSSSDDESPEPQLVPSDPKSDESGACRSRLASGLIGLVVVGAVSYGFTQEPSVTGIALINFSTFVTALAALNEVRKAYVEEGCAPLPNLMLTAAVATAAIGYVVAFQMLDSDQYGLIGLSTGIASISLLACAATCGVKYVLGPESELAPKVSENTNSHFSSSVGSESGAASADVMPEIKTEREEGPHGVPYTVAII